MASAIVRIRASSAALKCRHAAAKSPAFKLAMPRLQRRLPARQGLAARSFARHLLDDGPQHVQRRARVREFPRDPRNHGIPCSRVAAAAAGARSDTTASFPRPPVAPLAMPAATSPMRVCRARPRDERARSAPRSRGRVPLPARPFRHNFRSRPATRGCEALLPRRAREFAARIAVLQAHKMASRLRQDRRPFRQLQRTAGAARGRRATRPGNADLQARTQRSETVFPVVDPRGSACKYPACCGKSDRCPAKMRGQAADCDLIIEARGLRESSEARIALCLRLDRSRGKRTPEERHQLRRALDHAVRRLARSTSGTHDANMI